jgi:succinate-semialdehyde dehydrogenase/glutarate-semialdehyde dehydrogenase
MQTFFQSTASASRTITRSRFQKVNLPSICIRPASTMLHNVPKLSDPSLLKTNVAYVNGEWVGAKSGKTFEVFGISMTRYIFLVFNKSARSIVWTIDWNSPGV